MKRSKQWRRGIRIGRILEMPRRGKDKRTEIQLTLDAFDGGGAPLCGGQPGLNRYKHLCYQCPQAIRNGEDLICSLSGLPVRAWDKYSLKEWKTLRRAILERDGARCIICGERAALHIHHLDRNKTNDDPCNLLTLCEACHARVHVTLQNTEDPARIQEALQSARAFCREQERSRNT